MQQVLTFTYNKKKYISRPWNFEAMCLINDAHNSDEVKGPLAICRDAVDYMFEGTEATQNIINSLSPGTRSRLCLKLWEFYINDLSYTEKNGKSPAADTEAES